MGEVLARMNARTPTVAVAEVVEESLRLRPPEFEGAFDPHLWFDVKLWMKAAERVRDALSEVAPAHEAAFAENARAYLSQMKELDAYVREQAGQIPAEKRVLITAHDAFNYFGKAYGLQVRGLQGISTVSEAGTADVQDLAAFIAAKQIPAVFVETSVPPRAIEAVQAAVKARGFAVAIGGELFSDALGSPGTPEGTYLGMVRHNIDTVRAGLTR